MYFCLILCRIKLASVARFFQIKCDYLEFDMFFFVFFQIFFIYIIFTLNTHYLPGVPKRTSNCEALSHSVIFWPNSRQNAFVNDLVSFLVRKKKKKKKNFLAMFYLTISKTKLNFFCKRTVKKLITVLLISREPIEISQKL